MLRPFRRRIRKLSAPILFFVLFYSMFEGYMGNLSNYLRSPVRSRPTTWLLSRKNDSTWKFRFPRVDCLPNALLLNFRLTFSESVRMWLYSSLTIRGLVTSGTLTNESMGWISYLFHLVSLTNYAGAANMSSYFETSMLIPLMPSVGIAATPSGQETRILLFKGQARAHMGPC